MVAISKLPNRSMNPGWLGRKPGGAFGGQASDVITSTVPQYILEGDNHDRVGDVGAVSCVAAPRH
jgi:hypothetical protein